uniref:ATPdependent DNA helicase mer3 putative n=1 Tax=Albugo laibachii Nc14 TaxID=890382 RepID=F0WPA5_9STRA|nr:ATPdependent DNA helicase mer3 putative [Albugo laibachii Nc14]|eukprot:CCA23151.1 ATPdependent DNA helicase mer3 putative [Albugo laibachii Nc14]
MDESSRATVQQQFKSGKIQVLCCTSSFFIDVTQPARLVIIKSTQVYTGEDGFAEYSPSNILRMAGLAGRHGIDNHGMAVIMTKSNMVRFYEELFTDPNLIHLTSTLHNKLAEVINGEVLRGAVYDMESALSWLQQSFLFYGLRKELNEKSIAHARNILSQVLDLMNEEGIITLMKDANRICKTKLGELMDQFSLSRHTTRRIRELDFVDVSRKTLLELLSASHEGHHPLRRNERPVINALLKIGTRFALSNEHPIPQEKGKVSKYNVLLQSALARIDINEVGLQLERDQIVEHAKRVMTAIVEYMRHRGLGRQLWTAYDLWRCISLRLWNARNDCSILRQIHGADGSTKKILHGMQIRSLKQLAFADPRYMSEIMCRSIDFCKSLVTQAQSIAVYKIHSIVQDSYKNLRIRIESEDVGSTDTTSIQQTCCLIVFCEETLLCFNQMIKAPATFDVSLPNGITKDTRVQIRVLHEQYIGFDEYVDLPLEASGFVEYGGPELERIRQTRRLEVDKLNNENLSHLKNTKKFTKYVSVLTAHHTNAKQQTIRNFMKPMKKSPTDRQCAVVTPEKSCIRPRKRHKNCSNNISKGSRSTFSKQIVQSPDSLQPSKSRPVRIGRTSGHTRQKKLNSSTKRMSQLRLNLDMTTEKEECVASVITGRQLPSPSLNLDSGNLCSSKTSRLRKHEFQNKSLSTTEEAKKNRVDDQFLTKPLHAEKKLSTAKDLNPFAQSRYQNGDAGNLFCF